MMMSTMPAVVLSDSNRHGDIQEQQSVIDQDNNKNNTSMTRLSLSQNDKNKLLHKIPLIPVNCSFGCVTEKVDESVSVRKMIKMEQHKSFGKSSSSRKSMTSKPTVTVVFAIRRPGCGGCREHGLQITELMNKLKQEDIGKRICTVGIVKETKVDDNALLDFYNQYFHYPIYKDDKWDIFTKILGNRKISIWKLLYMIPTLERRYSSKKIINIPFGGDIYTQGGILIFDANYQLRHIHYENYSELYNIDDIKQSILNAMNIEMDDTTMNEVSEK